MALITLECLGIASKELKIEQISQVSQLFKLFHFLMRKHINDDVSKDYGYTVHRDPSFVETWQILSLTITKLVFAFGALCLYAQVIESLSLPYFRWTFE